MKSKNLFILCMLVFGMLFTACQQDVDFESDAQAKIDTRKATSKPTVYPAECTGLAFATCDCEYNILNVTRTFDDWRLFTISPESQCCEDGNEYPYIDETQFTFPLVGWQEFDCPLKNNVPIHFGFSSSDDGSCEFPENVITFKFRCGIKEKTFSIQANSGNDCIEGIGLETIMLNSECRITQ